MQIENYMKRNDFAEIKNLDTKTLATRVRALRAEIGDLVMDKHMNTLKNNKTISHKRRDLAQLLTVLRQKEIINMLESASEKGESN